MEIKVQFFSYFRDLTGCQRTILIVPPGSTLASLYQELLERFPRLKSMEKSTLMAVGVSYENRRYLLQPGDEVSLFPPVQGG